MSDYLVKQYIVLICVIVGIFYCEYKLMQEEKEVALPVNTFCDKCCFNSTMDNVTIYTCVTDPNLLPTQMRIPVEAYKKQSHGKYNIGCDPTEENCSDLN